MGFTSSDGWKSKKDVVAECLSHLGARYEVIAHRSNSDGLWAVVENRETKKRRIVFDLIQRERGRYYVKNLSEFEHPFYFKCPVAFFELAPANPELTDGINLNWRAAVLAQ